MNTSYTHIRDIIERIKREGFEEVHETDVKEYVWDIIGIIGTPTLLEDNTTEIEVKQYRGQLPMNFYSLADGGIRDKDTGTMFRKSTDVFHKLNRQKDLSQEINQVYTSVEYEDETPQIGTSLIATTSQNVNPQDYTYTMQRGVIFIPFEEKTLEITYKAFPIFEDNTPKIPDDPKIIRAVVGFVIQKIAKRMLLQGTLDYRIYQTLEQDYLFDVASARSKSLTLNATELENFKNRVLSLTPRPIEFRTGRRFQGEDSL